jgi:hypothetical protein
MDLGEGEAPLVEAPAYHLSYGEDGTFSETQAVGSTHFPGDVISTGTPGAVVIHEGDVVECRITGFEPLSNPVVR